MAWAASTLGATASLLCSLIPFLQVRTRSTPLLELVISQQHFKLLCPQTQSGFLQFRPLCSMSGSYIAMRWLKLAATDVSLCPDHRYHLVANWLFGSQKSLFAAVCACTALLFWFNTTIPSISYSASPAFTFYLYRAALPASFPRFLVRSVSSRTRAGPAAQ